MPDRRLQESWTQTRLHLGKAAALLPANQSDSARENLASYNEWIEHNELGLALDELEWLGANQPVPLEFWLYLRDAAVEMNLDQHVQRLTQKVENRAR